MGYIFLLQLVVWSFLAAVSVGGSPLAQPGGYGYAPKCRTEYETKYETKYETVYKPKCQTYYEQVTQSNYFYKTIRFSNNLTLLNNIQNLISFTVFLIRSMLIKTFKMKIIKQKIYIIIHHFYFKIFIKIYV